MVNVNMNRSGIYAIRHIESGRCYVGSTVCFRTRWFGHRRHLGDKKHTSLELQKDWDEHGAAAFEFVVLEELPYHARETFTAREQYHIDAQAVTVYNTRKRVDPHGYGWSHTEEAKAKMRGRYVSEETRSRMSVHQKGKPNQNRSAALRASRKAAEFHARQVGVKRSAETRAKMSIAAMGNRRALCKKHSRESVER